MILLVETLLKGSANIDRMERELGAITQMLFGMARHPSAWVKSEYAGHYPPGLVTSFGSFSEDECVWEVWWNSVEFRSRCLRQVQRETEDPVTVCAYGFSPNWSPENELPRSPKAEGILFAWSKLEIFAQGMKSEFPLLPPLDPFLKAAELSL